MTSHFRTFGLSIFSALQATSSNLKECLVDLLSRGWADAAVGEGGSHHGQRLSVHLKQCTLSIICKKKIAENFSVYFNIKGCFRRIFNKYFVLLKADQNFCDNFDVIKAFNYLA